MVLASIFGGVITGVGIGMVFLARATTGGTDMLAAVIQHYLKHYSIAQILQVLDGAMDLLNFLKAQGEAWKAFTGHIWREFPKNESKQGSGNSCGWLLVRTQGWGNTHRKPGVSQNP